MLPLVLILLALGSAAVMAYGTHPDWAQFEHGLTLIMLARRLQWPLVAASLILCIALIALVIAGRRRAWWLIGLAPVLALFVQRFSAGPAAAFAVYEEPIFVSASEATFIGDEDYVVGLQFQDDWYAYPYATLYHYPVITQADHDKRMMLLWSPHANRAIATRITRDLRGRDLDVVSMPASALLLYNMRIGQFINGLTGRTMDGAMPSGFQSPVATTKTTWLEWRSAHPDTQVLVAPGGGVAGGPSAPIQPRQKMPPIPSDVPADTLVTLVATTQPTAVLPEALDAKPLNLIAGGTPVFVFRDPAGVARGFDRHVEYDLMPPFRTARGEGRKGAAFIDGYTETAWSIAGVAMDGDLKGRKLTPVPIEEELPWGVMKYWYPQLELYRPTTQPLR
ncbi:MAG TPA: DUF3179 domain-containing (seleno)protein [Tepidisphaeraceae bacterium]|nr:DUF3179 domain-containing (seleno)protein [Tepidisphaeraceae bacterium]